MSMKGTNATRLDSRKLTDDDGLPLRSSHFPFRLDKQVPPRSAGYTMRVRPIDQTLAPSRKLSLNTSTSSIPTTYMMVDYQQDRKQISAKLLSDSMKAQQRHLNIPASFSTDRDKSSPTPKKHNPMRAQPLRSSFILQSRLPGDQDLNPIIMFNKEDKAVQSDAPIERQEMSISAYQAWSSKTVEPFFKDLRKAVKAQRPASLEEYVIAYCLARLHDQPPPDTSNPAGMADGSSSGGQQGTDIASGRASPS